jgi:hypothetical protein
VTRKIEFNDGFFDKNLMGDMGSKKKKKQEV